MITSFKSTVSHNLRDTFRMFDNLSTDSKQVVGDKNNRSVLLQGQYSLTRELTRQVRVAAAAALTVANHFIVRPANPEIRLKVFIRGAHRMMRNSTAKMAQLAEMTRINGKVGLMRQRRRGDICGTNTHTAPPDGL